MKNNELSNRISKNVREKIAVSNLEKEFNMKIKMKKQIITFSLLGVLLLSSSFFTVNAATNGELVNNVKETMKVWFEKEDGTKEKVKETTGKDKNGNYTEYHLENKDTEYNVKLYDSNQFNTTDKIMENETELMIKTK